MSEFSVVGEKPLSGKNQIRQNLERAVHTCFALRLQPMLTIYSGTVTGGKPPFSDVESIRRKA
jgi:hypothetical protein